MATSHQLTCTPGPGGLLFECEEPGCGRRVGIERDTARLVVIDHGDRRALHRGSSGGLEPGDPVLAQDH